MPSRAQEIESLVGYPCLLMGVTGSHMWGLADETSDLDVRGIFVKPTRKILSLTPGRDNIEHLGDIDLQFYEAEKACGMLLGHNGNLVELALSPTVFYIHPVGMQFQAIARKYLTKKLSLYYRGYATSQRKRAAENRGGRALIYTYREIYSGIWLMKTGKIEYDFHALMENIEALPGSGGIGFHSALLPRVLENPKEPVSEAMMRLFEEEWRSLCVTLEEEKTKSSLPDTYDGLKELDEWLLTLRATLWMRGDASNRKISDY